MSEMVTPLTESIPLKCFDTGMPGKCSTNCYIPSGPLFENGFPYVSQIVLELRILLPLPPECCCDVDVLPG